MAAYAVVSFSCDLVGQLLGAGLVLSPPSLLLWQVGSCSYRKSQQLVWDGGRSAKRNPAEVDIGGNGGGVYCRDLSFMR